MFARNTRGFSVAIGVTLAVAALVATAQQSERRKERTSPPGYDDTPVLPGQRWRVHDIDRPQPPLVRPGERPGDPPSDAIVLFDGKDLSHWHHRGRGPERGKRLPPRWKVQDGYMEVVGGTGDLVSNERFGDAQIHIEWAAPPVIEGSGQWRGNSGVLLMERYEIQVLDNWENPTYADGMAGAIYGQFPPLVNPARRPGEWQVFDIVFEAPRFEGERLVKPAYVTVFLNGVLVHHRQAIVGRMAHRRVGTYAPHEPEAPLALQDHDTAVRYRNIWVRRLKGYDEP